MAVSGYQRPRVRRAGSVGRYATGPWRAVRTTTDPLDDTPDLLYDASNVYNPDPGNASGFYSRPGFSLLNGGDPIETDTVPFRGQGVFYHTDLSSATTDNFVVFNGKLFRADATLSTFTDVTPVGVTIDPGVATRVYGTSLVDQFLVTDGVNTPWIASNLSATPITATRLQFNAADDDWTTFGPFVVYGGSVFCILGDVNGVAARTDIAWCIPGDAATGWQQTDYDFRWTLSQTATEPLFALIGDNNGLYYFREQSGGVISGAVGPDLQTSATHDLLAVNIGTQAPQTIVQYGTTKFFTDALARPYRLIQGADPEPIWLQMRSIVDGSTIGFPGVNRTVATAAFEPTLNLYIVAPFTSVSSTHGPSVEGYIFDGRTASYFGRFSVADGVQLEAMGTLIDQSGRGVFIVLGSAVAPSGSTLAPSGFVWAMNTLTSAGDFLTTEDGVFLTTEDGVLLTSEGIGAENWTDNGVVQSVYGQPGRMGYDPSTVLNVDRATVLVGTTDTCQVSAETAAVALTLEGTPTPSTVQDNVAKLVCGFDGVQGRGVQVRVQPTALTAQWSLQSVTVQATVSTANPDEV